MFTFNAQTAGRRGVFNPSSGTFSSPTFGSVPAGTTIPSAPAGGGAASGESYLIFIDAPSQGAGAFIGFLFRNGRIEWIPDGNAWAAYVQQGLQTRRFSDAQFADLLRAYSSSGAVPPAGYLSADTLRLFQQRIGAAPPGQQQQQQPAAPSEPPRPDRPQVQPAPETAMPERQPAPPEPVNVDAFIARMTGLFPWIEQLGLGFNWFHELAARSVGPEQVVAELRLTDQWRQRFPGIRRGDGSLRMNESQYFQVETSYRRLLNQYGMDVEQYATPDSLRSFFDSEMDANELGERLRVYQDLKDNTRNVRDAFYVYAGLRVSVDDLYEATVDSAVRSRLAADYNRQALSAESDYETFITRATQVAMERVAEDISQLNGEGVTPLQAQQVLQTDPQFARQVMDALYTGGAGANGEPETGEDGQPVSDAGRLIPLEELLAAFEYAALGAAALGARLELPSLERIRAIRSAGVDRTTAMRRYQEFAADQNNFRASLMRVRGSDFTQDDYERALFLGDPTAMRDFRQAQAGAEAAGRPVGAFRFDQNRTGDLFQRGLNI